MIETISWGVSGSVRQRISQDVELKINAGLNTGTVGDILAQVARTGEVNAQTFGPLVSGLNGTLGFGNASLGLGWDSDLCFLSVSGSPNFEFETQSLSGQGTLKFGLHPRIWVKLFQAIAARAPSSAALVLRIKSVLNGLFGVSGLTAARLSKLSRFFAGINKLNPWFWAIEIALLIRDFTVFETRRRRRQGYREGNMVAFASMFTRTIFNFRNRNFAPGAVGQIQRHAADYANRYRGQRRTAVQRYLNVFYGNGSRVRNSGDAQRVGEQFGIEGLGSVSASRANPHISARINSYFERNLAPWVREWTSERTESEE